MPPFVVMREEEKRRGNHSPIIFFLILVRQHLRLQGGIEKPVKQYQHAPHPKDWVLPGEQPEKRKDILRTEIK